MSTLSGCDISAFQSSIPVGQQFVILKATEGTTYIDSHFAGWWSELAGKLRGAYHFARPSNDPATEATHFLAEIEGRLKPGDLVVLDFETADGMSPAHCAAWAKTWLQHVHAGTGRVPIVYTFLNFAEEGYCAGLGGFPLWVADPSSSRGKPRVPAPWTSWVLHQYSTAGGIDRDVFNGSAADFQALGDLISPLQEDDVLAGWLKDGNGEPTILTWPAGKTNAIGFGCDNGYQKLPPAKIRVAVHSKTGGWSQIVNETVDSTKGKTVVTFTAKDVDEVSIARLDAGTVAVGWDAS